jgi:hypothetical protein
MRLLVATALLWCGCYAPKISEGDFQCVPPANLCPTGYVCVSGACYQSSFVPSLDLSTGPFVGDGSGGLLDLSTMSGLLELNTDTGEVRFTPNGGSASSIVMPGGGGYIKVAQPSGGPPVGLWQFTTVTIPSAVTVRPFGVSQSVFALAASDTLTIAGSIDWRGFGGPAGGAGASGDGRDSATTSGGGGASDTTGSGGGGGGYVAAGMPGLGAAPGAGGMSYGRPDLTPVHVGSGGGGGSNGAGSGAKAGAGGLGGGAVALFGNDVDISGTIDVSGNGGKSADTSSTMPAGGGGGGSAGSILVSGVSVSFTSGHALTAAGGVGGSGADGGFDGGGGSDGRIWIGATQLSTGGGTLMAMPTETRSQTPVSTFPR